MSVSSVSWSADANVRYERLAAEYAKLRSHASVLKNGVLEERSKNESLIEDNRAKESSIRKLRAENESLVFRNEQLTKRVQSLQDEIDTVQRRVIKHEKGSKKDPKPSPVELDLQRKVELLEEKLNNKLKQNMKLVDQISEMERLHSVEMSELSEKMAKELRNLEDKLVDFRRRELEWNAEHRERIVGKKVAGTPVMTTAGTETEMPAFENSENGVAEESVSSPVPPPPRPEAYRLCCTSARICLSALSTFFHLYSERTRLFPFDSGMEPVPETISKLSVGLSEASVSAHTVATVAQDILNKETFELSEELSAVFTSLSPLCQQLRSILPGMNILLIEESKGTWSNGALDRMSSTFHAAFSSFVAKMENLLEKGQSADVDAVADALQELALVLKELRDSFCGRWQLETRLPVATKRFQCVGGTLFDCLTQLNAESARLAARVQAAVHIQDTVVLEDGAGADVDHELENDQLLNDAADGDATMLNNGLSSNVTSSPTSSGFGDMGERTTHRSERERKDNKLEETDALSDVKTLDSGMISAGKSSETRLVDTDRMCALEAEREKLLVEISLLKRKITSNASLKDSSQNEPVAEHEDLVVLRQFFEERTRETFKLLQSEKEKVRYLTKECTILVRRAMECERLKDQLETSITDTEGSKIALEDELATMRRGYESQLSELSDHLAELSAKLEEKDRPQRSSIARKFLFQK